MFIRDLHTRFRFIIVWSLCLFVFSCNGIDPVDDDPTTPDGVDTSAPTVVGTVPADTQTGVELNANINVTFSEDCDAATITADSFTLTGGGATVSGAVSVSGSTATFNTDIDLVPNTTYTATVTSAVTDGAGNPLASDYTWRFTTTETDPSSATNLRTYIFGHSLINHEIGEATFQTNVPYWMSALTQAAGYTFSADGQHGYLPQHANLPPVSQWGFEGVASVWNSESGAPFADADFNSILMTAINFIQYQPADALYDGDNPDKWSPLTATLQIVDWVTEQEPGVEIFIYENWPDMAPFLTSFPATEEEFSEYNAYVQNEFHDWWIDYRNQVHAARPNAKVQMIPVGPIISWLLSNTNLSQIPFSDLYEDDAPHGRPTIYFLASLITYMQMQGVPAPDHFEVPASVHSLVQENYLQIVDDIWNQLLSHGMDRSD